MARTLLDTEKRLRDYLYWFCVAVTLAQMLMGTLEFLGHPQLGMPLDTPMAYLSILLAYVTRKEVDRWLSVGSHRRRGERFFWMWAFLITGMLLVRWFQRSAEPLPREVVECFFSATLVYLLSGASRAIHSTLWRRCGRHLLRRNRH